MKIGLVGGAFDPPHNGHRFLIETARPYFDQIWVLPAYDHVYGKKMQKATHRLEMCRLAFVGTDAIINDYEIENQITDGTYALIKRLIADYPQHQFGWVVGLDNANTITRWINYQKLLASIPFTVVLRTGYSDANEWYHHDPHQFILAQNLFPTISSTQIRQMIKENKKPTLIVESVYDYIRLHDLYLETEETKETT